MEELARLKERLSSLHELRDVIHAIRGMAASHVQEAQSALAGIRNYVSIVEEALGQAASLAPQVKQVSLVPELPSTSILIVVCSEHGFVGGYNDALLEHARGLLEPGQELWVIGRRGGALAEEKGLSPAWRSPGAAYVRGVESVARRIAGAMTNATHSAVVFARYNGMGGYTVNDKTVLPLDPALLTSVQQRLPPVHQLPPERLLQRLAGEYLFAELTRAIIEGLASESAARLMTMQGADHNIGDKLEALQRQERILRQESITVELLDVVTGAQAVEGVTKKHR